MGFWRKLTGSIQSPALIKEVYSESTGKAFKYFITLFTLVFMIVAIPVSIKGFTMISNFNKQLSTEVHDFKLHGGQLEFNGPQPYVVESNNFGIIVDTTGNTKEDALSKYDLGFLITKNQITQRQLGNVQVIDIPKDFYFDKAQAIRYIPFLYLGIIFAAIFLYIFYLAIEIAGVLMFAGLGILFVRRRDLITYGKAINIAIYASTLPSFLLAINVLAFPDNPYFFMIYAFVVNLYMVIAIRKIEYEK